METSNTRDMNCVERCLSNYQLYGDRMPNYAVTSMPLLEVFSVTVHPDLQVGMVDSCEIFGTIKVANGLGHVFDLYNRERDNPEFIKLDETSFCRFLSLTGPKDGHVIIPYEYVSVDMDLRDRARNNTIIAKGKLSFNFKDSFYTQHGTEIVTGEAGFVTLHYATSPYAVVATVDVLFFSKHDDYDMIDYDPDDYRNDLAIYKSCAYGSDYADIYGTVAARSNFHGSNSYGDSTAMSSILLNLSHDQCLRVKSRSFIELSRCVVAVPAYSKRPLQIHVDFKYKDGSTLAYGVLEFLCDGCSFYKKDIVGENGRIRVRVKWADAYEQRYRGSDLKRSVNEVSTPEVEESSMEEVVKRQRFHVDPQPSSPSNDWWGEPVLEVFSVGVFSYGLKPPFKLYGKINVNGCRLFERDESSPQICFDNKVEVKYCRPRAIMALDDFGIFVDIKDVDGNVVIRGQVKWAVRLLEPWYDRRICSLIRGDKGYAAVHYTVLYDGVQAHVNVLVRRGMDDTLDLPTKVLGSLVAQYSNGEYLTSYDKKYYQSVLLDCGSDDYVNLREDGSLPLSKSLVCVPRKSWIIIEADLTIGNLLPEEGVCVDSVRGSVKFNAADDGHSSKAIWGPNYSIDVSVTWPKFW